MGFTIMASKLVFWMKLVFPTGELQPKRGQGPCSVTFIHLGKPVFLAGYVCHLKTVFFLIFDVFF